MIGPADAPFLLLASTSVAYSISVRRLERLRRALANGKMPNLLSTWTIAGALILPPPLIVGAVAIAYAAEWPSRKIVNRGRPLRYLYSCVSAMAAGLTAAVVAHTVEGLLGLALTVLTAT